MHYLFPFVPVSLVLTFARLESAILSEELLASGVAGVALLLLLTSIEESVVVVDELALVVFPHDAINKPIPNIIAMHFTVFIKNIFH